MSTITRLFLLATIALITCGCAILTPGKKSQSEDPTTYAQRKQAALADFEKKRDATQLQAAVDAWQRGESQQARTMLAAVVQRSPQDWTARLRLAEILSDQEEASAAEEQLRECLQLAPDSAEVHHALGLLLSGWPGRETEADPYFRRASELEPDNAAYAAVAD